VAAWPEVLSCAIARRLTLALIKAKRLATSEPKAIALLRVAAATLIGHKPLDGPGIPPRDGMMSFEGR
jgi:hypothetical protein